MKNQNQNLKNDKTDQQNRPLTCCICHKICRHIQVLPCCHSTACKSCLKEWIEKQDICPHCGAHLRVPKQKLCKAHRKPLDYYCQTCNQYLCCDCLLEQIQSNGNKQHADHKIVKASEIGAQPRKDLESYLQSLKSFSDSLDEQFRILQDQKNLIGNKKLNTLYQSNVFFDYLKREIELVYQEKQQDYKHISDLLEEQMMKFQSILEESEIILTSNDPKMVPSAQSNINKIKKMNEEFVPMIPKPQSLEFPNKLVPPPESFKVTIPSFKDCLLKIKNESAEVDHILSEEQKLFGCIWRAKIFPNGTQVGKGTHLAVYVELLSGEKLPTSFNYQFEILATHSKTPNINRRYTSEFRPLDSWGWSKLVLIEKLLAGYLDKDGSLTIKISLSPSSYKFCIQQKRDEYKKITEEWRKLKDNVLELKKKQNIEISDDNDDNDIDHNDGDHNEA